MSHPPRFHAPLVRDSGQEILLRGEEHHHLRRVLRLREGDPVSLFDGDGRGFTGRILAVAAAESRILVEAAEPDTREPSLRLELAAALAKGGKFELVLQKGTELGVAAFHPLFTHRTDVRPVPGKEADRGERWKRVVLEACKQSGRTRLPEVFPARSLAEFLAADPAPGAIRLLLDPEAPAGRRWPTPSSAPARLILAVGPEGGWTAGERDTLAGHGFQPVRLGPRVLRAETAAIVSAALAQFLCGDLDTPPPGPPLAPRG